MSSHHSPAKWLVPNLIAEHSVNLIAGSSRVGKTALALTMLDDYLRLGSMLDYQGSGLPLRPAALVLDRPTRSLQRALTDLGCDALGGPRSFPIAELSPEILSAARRLSSAEETPAWAILQSVRSYFPSPPPNFLFIEAIDRLLRSGSPLNPNVVGQFMFDLHEFCQQWDTTILGTIGACKVKIGEGYVCPIDLIAGSSAWGSGADTSIILSVPEASYRAGLPAVIRKFCAYVPGCAERFGYMRITTQGRMELQSPEDVPALIRSDSMLTNRLSGEPEGKEFIRETFIAWGQEYEISQRSVDRWIRSALELGLLLKLGSTSNARYQKPVTQ